MATSFACCHAIVEPALQARGDCFVVPLPGTPLRVRPGFNVTGIQPGNLSGLKARNLIAQAEGPGNPPPQISPAL